MFVLPLCLVPFATLVSSLSLSPHFRLSLSVFLALIVSRSLSLSLRLLYLVILDIAPPLRLRFFEGGGSCRRQGKSVQADRYVRFCPISTTVTPI